MYYGLTEVSERLGIFKLSRVFDKSRLHFQLVWKALTILRANPRARVYLESQSIDLVIDKCRLCPKHESLGHSRSLAAFLMLLPLSVVKHT